MSSNRFCDQCGAPIPRTNSRFCSACGSDLVATDEQEFSQTNPEHTPIPNNSLEESSSEPDKPLISDHPIPMDAGSISPPRGNTNNRKRPVWRKWKFILGVPVGLLVFLVFLGIAFGESSSSGSSKPNNRETDQERRQNTGSRDNDVRDLRQLEDQIKMDQERRDRDSKYEQKRRSDDLRFELERKELEEANRRQMQDFKNDARR